MYWYAVKIDLKYIEQSIRHTPIISATFSVLFFLPHSLPVGVLIVFVRMTTLWGPVTKQLGVAVTTAP